MLFKVQSKFLSRMFSTISTFYLNASVVKAEIRVGSGLWEVGATAVQPMVKYSWKIVGWIKLLTDQHMISIYIYKNSNIDVYMYECTYPLIETLYNGL
jgi:hypothetical protein